MNKKKILITISAVCVIALLLIAVMKSSLLSLQTITIEMDASSADKQTVEELSGLQIGQSIFSISASAVEEAINESGTYHAVSVEIHYPNAVTIQAEKRVICAAVEYENSYLLIDKDCNVLSMQETVDDYTIIITGINVSQFRSGEPLSTRDPQQKNALISTLNAIEEYGISKHISRMAFENLTDIYIITPNGVKVDLCEAANIREKLSWLTKDTLINQLYSETPPQSVTLYANEFVIKK